MRNVLMAFVTLTLTLSVAFASYAMDGWRQQEGGWYYYQNEQRLADQWINENLLSWPGWKNAHRKSSDRWVSLQLYVGWKAF